MATEQKIKEMEKKSLDIRIQLLKLCEQTLIHIGGDLSATEIMTVIWQYAMKYDVKNPHWELRDRFILSKGHASAVTSFNQAAIGCYALQEIYNEYAQDNGRFGMHSCNLLNPYVDVSTGSLGHGLPVSVGIAQALKMKGSKSRIFVVVGDGEMNEGTMWEALMAAAKYELGNLIVFVDYNKMQFDGFTSEVMPIEPFADKWRVFNWNVVEIDGHDMGKILDTIDGLPSIDSNKPTVVIADTVKGKGVDFMENSPAWHAGKINEEKLNEAVTALTSAFETKWGGLTNV
jgi:transketolase